MKMMTAEEVMERMDVSASKKYLFGLDFEMERGFFVEDPLAQSEILWRVGSKSNFGPSVEGAVAKAFASFPMAFEAYEKGFEVVRKNLLWGNSFLTNLTMRTPLRTDYSLREMAFQCWSPYLLFVPDRFLCFTPEPFVRVDSASRLFCHPMKGTIDAGLPDAEARLLADFKESAEHNTIVDLIRNDMSRVATEVEVERFRYIERIAVRGGAILQSSSQIAGLLLPEYRQRMGSMMRCLLPAGSVSGAPKRSTMNIIREAEGQVRGFYCGVFGYFDGESLDSAVLIRYIEEDAEGVKYFRSGSGITVNSEARAEYAECVQKIYLPFSS